MRKTDPQGWPLREDAHRAAQVGPPTALAGPPTVVEEPPPPPDLPPDPARDVWPWLLLLGLLVLAGAAALWWFRFHDNSNQSGQQNRLAPAATVARSTPRSTTASAQRIVVPSLIGQRRAVAADELRALGLEARVVLVQSTQQAGTVVAQAPSEGSRIAKGAFVTLRVGHERTSIAIPDLRGDTVTEALATIRKAGFKPLVRNVSSPEPAGTVVALTPPPGAEATRGTEVRLNVSKGRRRAPTPATPARTSSVKKATTTVDTTTSAPRAKSKPASPSPSPGSSAPAVPRVVGMTQTSAIGALEQQNLHASVTLVPSEQPAGEVLEQQPAASSKAAPGDTVELQVSLGANAAPMTDVPDVSGQDASSARAALEQAGFSVETVERQADGTGSNAVVVAELPSGQAPQGWTITLVLGHS